MSLSFAFPGFSTSIASRPPPPQNDPAYTKLAATSAPPSSALQDLLDDLEDEDENLEGKAALPDSQPPSSSPEPPHPSPSSTGPLPQLIDLPSDCLRLICSYNFTAHDMILLSGSCRTLRDFSRSEDIWLRAWRTERGALSNSIPDHPRRPNHAKALADRLLSYVGVELSAGGYGTEQGRDADEAGPSSEPAAEPGGPGPAPRGAAEGSPGQEGPEFRAVSAAERAFAACRYARHLVAVLDKLPAMKAEFLLANALVLELYEVFAASDHPSLGEVSRLGQALERSLYLITKFDWAAAFDITWALAHAADRAGLRALSVLRAEGAAATAEHVASKAWPRFRRLCMQGIVPRCSLLSDMISAERTAEFNSFGHTTTQTVWEAGEAWFRSRVVLREGVRQALQAAVVPLLSSAERLLGIPAGGAGGAGGSDALVGDAASKSLPGSEGSVGSQYSVALPRGVLEVVRGLQNVPDDGALPAAYKTRGSLRRAFASVLEMERERKGIVIG